VKALLALAAAVGLAAAVVAITAIADANGPREPSVALGGDGSYRGSEPPVTIRLPSFTLRNYTGETVRAADLRGKVTLLTFLDSQCEEACPIIASVVARSLEALGDNERRRVTAVAISTDPTEDTPEAIRAFLGKQHALDAFLYLRGTEREMRPVWRRFQVLSSLETGADEVHSAPVRIYNADGVWLATLHAGADLTRENLLHDVRVALE
jgi:protein SCO1/2